MTGGSSSHQDACLEMGQRCGSCWVWGWLCCHVLEKMRHPFWLKILERIWDCRSCMSCAFPETSVQGLCPLLSGSFPLYLAFFPHVVVQALLFKKEKKEKKKKERQRQREKRKKTKTKISRSHQFHFGFLVFSHSLKEQK